MRKLSLSLLLAATVLAGCGPAFDPYQAEGRWRPSGSNEANLRTMLAEPRDLVAGRGTAQADGHLAASAVERLREDKVRPLPTMREGGTFGSQASQLR